MLINIGVLGLSSGTLATYGAMPLLYMWISNNVFTGCFVLWKKVQYFAGSLNEKPSEKVMGSLRHYIEILTKIDSKSAAFSLAKY